MNVSVIAVRHGWAIRFNEGGKKSFLGRDGYVSKHKDFCTPFKTEQAAKTVARKYDKEFDYNGW